jgi:hypothetical protein
VLELQGHVHRKVCFDTRMRDRTRWNGEAIREHGNNLRCRENRLHDRSSYEKVDGDYGEVRETLGIVNYVGRRAIIQILCIYSVLNFLVRWLDAQSRYSPHLPPNVQANKALKHFNYLNYMLEQSKSHKHLGRLKAARE